MTTHKGHMIFREARVTDIDELHTIRLSVKENVLSNPEMVTKQDYERYLTTHGKGWLCKIQDKIAAFAIIDLEKNNIWALFVHPAFEGKGIGKKLHAIMLEWYFNQNKSTLWLSTDLGTRAEAFYRKAGWKEAGELKGEIKFEMTYPDWKKNS